MYTSASGMLAETARHDTIANNLANVSTVGFKHDAALMRAHPTQQLHRIQDNLFSLRGYSTDLAPVVGTRGQGTIVDAIATNFSQGSMLETGSGTDLALQGQGLFAIQTPRGRRYTRAGNFDVDGMGRLVTQTGDPVLNSSGGIIHVGAKDFVVGSDGFFFLDGDEIGRIGVFSPDDPDMLIKEGESLFAPAPGARFRASGATVSQGFLERANVNPIQEMAAMLEALRAYEANQRAIVAQDGTLDTLISQVGRFS